MVISVKTNNAEENFVKILKEDKGKMPMSSALVVLGREEIVEPYAKLQKELSVEQPNIDALKKETTLLLNGLARFLPADETNRTTAEETALPLIVDNLVRQAVRDSGVDVKLPNYTGETISKSKSREAPPSVSLPLSENEKSFLTRIAENPKDDNPRLAYADWLEKQGKGERAEFVRNQVEAAGLREQLTNATGDEAKKLWNDINKIESQEQDGQREQFATELGLPKGVKINVNAKWKRGFPVSVEFHSAEAFASHAQQVYKTIPDIKASVWEDAKKTPEGIKKVMDNLPDKAHKLSLYGSTDKVIQEIANHPKAEQITDISLSGIPSRSGNTRLIEDTPSAELTDASIKSLAESQYAKNIENLDLGGNLITDKGAELIATSQNFAKLKSLRVDENLLSQTGIEKLSDSNAVYSKTIKDIKTKIQYPQTERSEIEEDLPMPDYVVEEMPTEDRTRKTSTEYIIPDDSIKKMADNIKTSWDDGTKDKKFLDQISLHRKKMLDYIIDSDSSVSPDDTGKLPKPGETGEKSKKEKGGIV